MSGEVELNEAFFPIRVPEESQGEVIRRGAGSRRQAKVLAIVESKSADEILPDYLKSQTNEVAGKSGKFANRMKNKSVKKVVHYIKMLVLDNLNAGTIDKIVREHVGKDTIVVTDNSSSHVNFAEYFSKHGAFTEKGNVDDVEMWMLNSCSYTLMYSAGNSTGVSFETLLIQNTTCLIGWSKSQLSTHLTSNGEITNRLMTMMSFKIC